MSSVVVNATLNILAVALLPQEWRHVGLAASTVVCAALGCAIFVTVARLRGQSLGLVRTLPYLAKVVLASLVMAAAVFAADLYSPFGNSIVRLICDLVVGGLVYLVLSIAFRTLRLPAKLAALAKF